MECCNSGCQKLVTIITRFFYIFNEFLEKQTIFFTDIHGYLLKTWVAAHHGTHNPVTVYFFWSVFGVPFMSYIRIRNRMITQ